jgi:hypothetical protein
MNLDPPPRRLMDVMVTRGSIKLLVLASEALGRELRSQRFSRTRHRDPYFAFHGQRSTSPSSPPHQSPTKDHSDVNQNVISPVTKVERDSIVRRTATRHEKMYVIQDWMALMLQE